MKSLIVLTLLSLTSFAEKYEYKIEGMSCSGCKHSVKAAVCKLPGIKECQVEIGSMQLTSEEGKTLDQKAIQDAIAEVNQKNKEDYKIVSQKKVTTK